VTSPHGSTNHPGGSPGQVWMDGYGWVQPIKDKRGAILYYADPATGARVTRNINGPETGPGSGNTTTAAQAKKLVDRRGATQTAPDVAAASRTAVANQVWLDGKLVSITQGADGSWTSTPVGGGASSPLSMPTAFDALDGNALDPAMPVLMGYSMPKGSENSWGAMFGAKKNMLTVGAAAGWLAELSTKDPQAYQAMLDKLHNAAYLSDDDYATADGKWSSAAGTAFATAARDTAVVNTTVTGGSTTLSQFLDSKQGARDAKKKASSSQPDPFQPVQRTYTDPEDVKAAAKSKAEGFLGRQLSDAEEAQLVSHFRGLEDAAYDAVDAGNRTNYDRALDGQDGLSVSVTKPGDGQVDAYVEGPGHEQEGADYRAAEYGMALKQLFSQTKSLA
jgi:hypothetical protein